MSTNDFVLIGLTLGFIVFLGYIIWDDARGL